MWNAPITIRPERRVDSRRDVSETAPAQAPKRVRGDRVLEGHTVGRGRAGQAREDERERSLSVRDGRGARQRIGTIIDDYA